MNESNQNLITYVISEQFANQRIDKALAKIDDSHSRSYYQKLLKDQKILLNGTVPKDSTSVKVGDVLEIEETLPVTLDAKPEDIPLDILYEDDDLLVVNKPKQMVVHPAPGHEDHTLVNALLFHCGDSLSGINGVMRPGIVHRIDQDTTGSLIVCKNDFSHQNIAEQISTHSFTRKYLGIVHGNPKELEGTIHAPIGRNPSDRKKMAINYKNGKDAITHYKVLEELNGYSYVEFTLETGRTHQIRVHMASIHHPLLGDPLYGPKKVPIKGLEGQTLHAYLIGFHHPRTGEYIEIEAPLPQYFEDLLTKLRK